MTSQLQIFYELLALELFVFINLQTIKNIVNTKQKILVLIFIVASFKP